MLIKLKKVLFAQFMKLRPLSVLSRRLDSYLSILFSEMDPADTRLILSVIIKETGSGVFRKNLAVPHSVRAL